MMGMSYHIAITSYLNTQPLFYHRPLQGCQILQLPPAATVKALLKGSLVGGIVPVAGLPLLADDFELLGPYGIACKGAVLSVALFSKIPFEALNHSHRLLLSPESMSSNRLLFQLLQARKSSLSLPKVVTDDDADAELIIGDQALFRYYRQSDHYVTDLSEQWWRQTAKPFVFARWVIQKNASSQLKQRLLDWLVEGNHKQTELNRLTAVREQHRFQPLNKAQILNYLQRIDYKINAEAQLGQNIFMQTLLAPGKFYETQKTAETALLKAS